MGHCGHMSIICLLIYIHSSKLQRFPSVTKVWKPLYNGGHYEQYQLHIFSEESVTANVLQDLLRIREKGQTFVSDCTLFLNFVYSFF